MPRLKKTLRGKYPRLRSSDTSIEPRNGTEQQLHEIQGRLAAIDSISWMLPEKRDQILVASEDVVWKEPDHAGAAVPRTAFSHSGYYAAA
ncbi:hypothetical protein N7535_003653 [Penicillium sp. DV-2018c]|nr:hypothetical protein N7535_003653 [Penicillium sp. DV-2018c]